MLPNFLQQHSRLVRMRAKTEERSAGTFNALALQARTVTVKSHRRCFDRWFPQAHSAAEGFYEDVLLHLTKAKSCYTLLEYEKMWTEQAIRHTAPEVWNGDPAISATIPKKTLEQQLRRITKVTDEAQQETKEDADAQCIEHNGDRFSPEELALLEDKNRTAKLLRLTCNDEDKEPIALPAPVSLPTVEVNVVPLNNVHPYDNHGTHWIFESAPAQKTKPASGKHRIKRVVGF